jgi:hypothetical protein
LAILRAMSEAVQKTGNTVLIDKYAQKTALRLGVTPDAVRLEFKKAPPQKNVRREETDSDDFDAAEAPSPPAAMERWLLKLLLINEELVDWAAAKLDPRWIEHDLVQQIVIARLEAHRAQSWTSVAGFLAAYTDPRIQTLVTEVATEDRPLPNPGQQLKDVALRLRNNFITRQMNSLLQQLNQPSLSDEERLQLLQRQLELRRLKGTSLEEQSPPS